MPPAPDAVFILSAAAPSVVTGPDNDIVATVIGLTIVTPAGARMVMPAERSKGIPAVPPVGLLHQFFLVEEFLDLQNLQRSRRSGPCIGRLPQERQHPEADSKGQ